MPGKQSRLNKDRRREANIVAGIACPVCGVPKGSPCRAGVHQHDPRRGIEDMREILPRVHSERRAARTALLANVNAAAGIPEPRFDVPVTAPLCKDFSGVPTSDLRWEDVDERRELRRRHKQERGNRQLSSVQNTGRAGSSDWDQPGSEIQASFNGAALLITSVSDYPGDIAAILVAAGEAMPEQPAPENEYRYPCPASGPGSNCGECSRCMEQDRRAMDGEE